MKLKPAKLKPAKLKPAKLKRLVLTTTSGTRLYLKRLAGITPVFTADEFQAGIYTKPTAQRLKKGIDHSGFLRPDQAVKLEAPF